MNYELHRDKIEIIKGFVGVTLIILFKDYIRIPKTNLQSCLLVLTPFVVFCCMLMIKSRWRRR